MTPDEAVAVQAISATQARYATSGDRGRLDELLETFVPDGVLEFHGRAHTGYEAIRAALTRPAPEIDGPDTEGRARRPFMRHNLSTRHVEFDGADAAHARTYFLVVTPLGLDHTGVYVDRFVRRGGHWLIAHRQVRIDWAATESAQAAHTHPAHQEGTQG